MNYEQMSDWSINKAVAEKLGGYRNETPKILSAEVGFNEYVGDGQFRRTTRDYCNNPEDAWPIIKEHRIMMNPYCADDLWKAEHPVGEKQDGFQKYARCYDDNPLRAAMIVYLMMQADP